MEKRKTDSQPNGLNTESSVKGHKDRTCIHCERLFDCPGKVNRDDLCVLYKERKDGRTK